VDGRLAVKRLAILTPRSPQKRGQNSTPVHTLFAGHEVGAENWALLASIVATCKLSDVNPVAYIAATLEAILNGHPQSRIEDLMPWHFRKTSSPNA
jgi:transposase